jgi:hypothetical protein
MRVFAFSVSKHGVHLPKSNEIAKKLIYLVVSARAFCDKPMAIDVGL